MKLAKAGKGHTQYSTQSLFSNLIMHMSTKWLNLIQHASSLSLWLKRMLLLPVATFRATNLALPYFFSFMYAYTFILCGCLRWFLSYDKSFSIISFAAFAALYSSLFFFFCARWWLLSNCLGKVKCQVWQVCDVAVQITKWQWQH